MEPEPTFEEFAEEVERWEIAKQIDSNSLSFIEHQTRAWGELQKWWVEAQDFGRPPETANGPGSTLEATEQIREWLSGLLIRYDIQTMLDAPCGDWNWMNSANIGEVEYTGWDTDPNVIADARERLAHMKYPPDALFERVNLLTVPEIPEYDLILSRDFFAHLPNKPIQTVLRKFEDSGTRYLLASNYPDAVNDFVYKPQDFTYFGYLERPVNLEAGPFSLTKIEATQEKPGPSGVISQPHELALFELNP
jgi:hypothetical protein